ncbi:MAG: hypothetical protein JWN04_2089 [Myxococcaceae bacterium]|nr:hypothetical protein [Myxococcaceae bacterium]
MSRSWRSRLATVVPWLLALAALTNAWPSPARAQPTRAFHSHAQLEVPLLVAAASAWIASDILQSKLAPRDCRWCSRNALDGQVRDAAVWSHPRAAAHASDALLFGVVPLATFGGVALMAGHHPEANALATDMLMLSEAVVLTADLTLLTKYVFGRQRPYAYAARVDHLDVARRPQDNLSFFSGHSSSTFSMAVAAGTIATLRGYEQAPWVWAIGMPLAALTGYFRIAADKHYFTDVLTGALVGSAVGVLVPWLHTRMAGSSMPSMSVAPGTLSFSWVR